MATLKNGNQIPLNGKVGFFVYSSTKSPVATNPSQLRLTKDRVFPQNKSDSKFNYLKEYIAEILPYIRLGFKNYHEEWTSYHAAMSYNFKNAIIERESRFELNWEKFSISKGFENPIQDIKIELCDETDSFRIYWDYDKILFNAYNMDNYRIMILLQPESNGENKIYGMVNGNLLLDKQQELFFRKKNKEAIYHLYVAFLSNDGSYNCTDSMYLGEI
ncbi:MULTISPECIES: DUF6266 family protein [Sphingobacterium]|uniref:DUF6266 family protein n=1 Tax=Sphingobacterium TaxID=28453 RepID=UPI00289B481F|nr:DUF6266 family protein [Sphingobacterium mizutaii]